MEIPAQQNITNTNFHKSDNYVLTSFEKISVGPDFKWPEVYEYLTTQSGLLHQSFPGNTTKGCVGAIDMVVNREAEKINKD